jgi:hypothetical protein
MIDEDLLNPIAEWAAPFEVSCGHPFREQPRNAIQRHGSSKIFEPFHALSHRLPRNERRFGDSLPNGIDRIETPETFVRAGPKTVTAAREGRRTKKNRLSETTLDDVDLGRQVRRHFEADFLLANGGLGPGLHDVFLQLPH